MKSRSSCQVPGASWGETQERCRVRGAGLTVDVDGNSLGEDIAIAADEGGDLAELVGLQELLGGLRGIDLDNLELEAISLRNREDGGGAGVELCDETCCQLTQIKRGAGHKQKTTLLLTSLVKIFPKGAMVAAKPGAGKSWEWERMWEKV